MEAAAAALETEEEVALVVNEDLPAQGLTDVAASVTVAAEVGEVDSAVEAEEEVVVALEEAMTCRERV